MAQYLIKRSGLKGEMTIPSSKSQTQRALLFGLLGQGKSIIYHPLCSPDTQAMIEACRLFGGQVERDSKKITIQGLSGHVKHVEDVINACNSGIVLRFCSAVGALGNHPVVVTGDHSIRHQRPMQPLLDGLSQLGVKAISMRGDQFAPVIIQGPLKPGKAVMHGEDSQPISALLIASAFAKGSIELIVKNPGEKPWVNLTLHWFDRLGISYENHDFTHYRITGNSLYSGFEYHVPGDFSSAAFPIAAALVTNSEISLDNVDMHDLQGDKEVISVFQKMGANILIDEANKRLHVKKSAFLKGIKVDINNFIDAITILAVVGCFAEGETILYNGAIAKQKECNRIRSIFNELKKMGANITENDDGLSIKTSSLQGTKVESYQDHRMAMSLAVAALAANGETRICNTQCVSKTYSDFVRDFQSLGAQIEELP